MKRYKVCGKVEYNWELTVSADSPEEAEEYAKGLVEDGNGLTSIIDTPELYEDPKEIICQESVEQ